MQAKLLFESTEDLLTTMSGQSQSHLTKHQALSNLVLQTHFPKHLRSRTTCTEAIILVLGVHGQRKIAGNIFLKMTGNMIGSLHSLACCRFACPPRTPHFNVETSGPPAEFVSEPVPPTSHGSNQSTLKWGAPGARPSATCRSHNLPILHGICFSRYFPLGMGE